MIRKAITVTGIIASVILIALMALRAAGSPSKGKAAARTRGIPWPAVIAHRGASYLAPEHTVIAYETARDAGADYLEIDIQRTADGALVAVHDENLKRTTNVSDIFPSRKEHPIRSFTLAELKRLDAGSWFNKKYPERAGKRYRGLRILTLREIIDIAESGNGRPGLYIESKFSDHSPGLERDIVVLLTQRKWVGEHTGLIIFQSFDEQSLLRFRHYAPAVPVVLLVDEKMRNETGLPVLLERAAAAGAGVGLVGYLGWPWNIGCAHRLNLVVHIYTINELLHFRIFSFFGADGFFTDRPGRLCEYYGRRGRAVP